MNAKVPMSETGMVTAGMMVARQSSRKRKMTAMTMTMASASVTSTSRIESPTAVVESKAMAYFRPGGKLFESSASAALACAVHIERVGVRELLHADAHRVMAAVLRAQCCSLRRRPRRGPHPSAAPGRWRSS